MVKMFHLRRNPEPAQKKQITESSDILADVMLKHLTLKSSGELSHSFIRLETDPECR
jgi:E3 ubiquitin-protein ligase HUWE1